MVQGATLRGFLDRLDTEKMHTAAEDIRVKGWKWVETALSFPRGPTQQPAASALYGRPCGGGRPEFGQDVIPMSICRVVTALSAS